MVELELVYCPIEGSQVHLRFTVKPGSTLAEALESSGIYKTHPEAKELTVGIFSKQMSLDSLVKSGDRIEIYRSLTLDPKEKRRQRAKKA